ncbi:hypothetical protein Trydic_g16364 [Trypoxylus dichotomus]
MNYNTTEREALAIVDCSKVVISTDHQPLRWLMSLKTQVDWLARHYKFSTMNFVADILSRPALSSDESLKGDINLVLADLLQRGCDDIRKEHLLDTNLKKIIDVFGDDSLSNEFVRWIKRGYIMMNGVLYLL